MHIEDIMKGKTFYPLAAFRNKLFLYIITTFVVVTSGIIGFGNLIGFFVNLDPEPSGDAFGRFITNNFVFLVYAYLFICFSIMLIASFLVVIYTNTMEFQVLENEVIVKKGVINKEVKHIPLRNITNVSSRFGIYDRLFGIGTVEIETAGKSGQTAGPEAKIEGIRNFLDVRDLILDSLRHFRGQYTTTTEVEPSLPVLVPITEQEFHKEMLAEIREIKELLSK
ncbi:MAG: PH domain-containing protein [Candidatus Hodarchaeota archaeon]